MTSKQRIAGRVVAWTAAATLGLGAVAGVALAAPGTTPSPSPATKHAGQHKGDRHGGLGHLGKRALHGEFVAKGKAGGYVTVDGQRGAVTRVSSTQITLKSADGFTATYVITADTRVRKDGNAGKIGDVKVGDQALVLATKAGNTKTAKGVVVGDPKAGKAGKAKHN